MIYQRDIHALMTAIIYAAGDKEITIAGAALQAEAINAHLAKIKTDCPSVREKTKRIIADTPLPQGSPKPEHTFQGRFDSTVKPAPWYCGPDAGKPRMTPLELTIQSLMAPDKNGNVGRPIRSVAMESFGRIENRTLDALWKFAEGVASSCGGCPTVDAVQDLTARAESAEGCLAEEYDKRKVAEANFDRLNAMIRGEVPCENAYLADLMAKLAEAVKVIADAPGRGKAMREALGIPLDTPIEQVVETARRIRTEAARVVKIHDLGLLGFSCDSRAIEYLRCALIQEAKG